MITGKDTKTNFPPASALTSFQNLSQVRLGGRFEIKNGKHLKVDCIVLFYKVIFCWLPRFFFSEAKLAQFQLNFRLGLSRVRVRAYPWCNHVEGEWWDGQIYFFIVRILIRFILMKMTKEEFGRGSERT